MENLEFVNQNLNRRGFKSCIVPGAHEALTTALGIIGSCSVGIGGSLSVEQIKLYDELKQRGNAVFWHWRDGAAAKIQAARADFYVCSANAVTADGIIFLTDGSGNRISALFMNDIFNSGSVGIDYFMEPIQDRVCIAFVRKIPLSSPKKAWPNWEAEISCGRPGQSESTGFSLSGLVFLFPGKFGKGAIPVLRRQGEVLLPFPERPEPELSGRHRYSRG